MTPAEIVAGIESGDEAAELALYELMRGGTRWMAARQLNRYDDVKDCVQQVYLEVLAAIRAGTVREPERLLAFVRTIARRVIAQVIEGLVRKRNEAGLIEWYSPVVRPHIERDLIEQERRELMVRTLAQMSARDREILTRFYLDEQPWERICAEMGMSEDQFRLAKWRAKARLTHAAMGEYARRGLPKAA